MATRLFPLLICLILSSPVTAQSGGTNTPPTLTFLAPSYVVPFVWASNPKGTIQGAHAALLVPVRVAHSTQTFYMQLDTGSPVSILYRQQANRLGLSDTTRIIPDVELLVGNQTLIMKNPSVVSKTAPPSLDPTDPVIIGTLGTDLFATKIVLMDYPNQRLTLLDDLPQAMQQLVRWSPLLFERGNLLLPAQIGGQAKLLYWDTGSSSFALLTDPASWSRLAAQDSVRRRYSVQSWNRTLIAHTIATRDSIQLAGRKIPIGSVSYIEGATDSQISRMMALGIGGLTGNQLFLKSVLLLDIRNRQYGFVTQ